VAERGLGDGAIPGGRRVHRRISAHRGSSEAAVILRRMPTFPCHECGHPVPEGAEIWLDADGRVDEASGEPFCPGCAAPLGIAA
jgi:hypothetical protein